MIPYEVGSFLLALLTFISLIGLFAVEGLWHTSYRQRKLVLDHFCAKSHPSMYWRAFRFFCRDERPDFFFFSILCTRYILLIAYIVLFSATFFGSFPLANYLAGHAWIDMFEVFKLISLAFLLIATVTVFSDVLPRTWASYSPASLLRLVANPASFFLLLLSPLTLFICRVVKLVSPQATFSAFGAPQGEILEFMTELGAEFTFNDTDKRLLLSILNFRNRIAREIMRPRVGLFCIPEDLSIQQAAEMLQREGYSRVPVYRGTIDSIVGVLLYKDVLSRYVAAAKAGEQKEQLLSTSIKALVKNVFYCPETKKIASLLQEFRKKKTHLAVIVDEYGGTAGLVTIEDILEEIVGEISDEYDDQEILYQPSPAGGWIVDARMNLLDVEEELGIHVPQEEDYDTLAGYVFYRVGSIPPAGLVLHHDNFEIEVIKSNDRMVQEVRICPVSPSPKSEEQPPSS